MRAERVHKCHRVNQLPISLVVSNTQRQFSSQAGCRGFEPRRPLLIFQCTSRLKRNAAWPVRERAKRLLGHADASRRDRLPMQFARRLPLLLKRQQRNRAAGADLQCDIPILIIPLD